MSHFKVNINFDYMQGCSWGCIDPTNISIITLAKELFSMRSDAKFK
jgi:hypothetical protein